MILAAENLTFGYGKKGGLILEDFSCQAETGETLGIVAPSGRGKTTLCQLLAGYLVPEKGRITLDGREFREDKGYCPVQMIWQHPEKAVNPRLRMGEVLAEGDGIGEEIIDGLGIERDWYNRFPGELSGGELQRFCIARALGRGTKFIIADEITTMLDLITQSQIWNFLLAEVARRGLGLIAVSHSQPLIRHICQRVIEL